MGFRCRLEKYRENEDLLRKVKWKSQGNAVCKRLHQTKPLRVSSLKRQPANAYAFATKAAAEKPVAVKAHERKRQSGNVLDVVPEGARTEVVEHRLPENERICSACGSQMVEIGKEVRRTLQMKPAEFWVREDVYYTYACKNCEQETGEANIVKAVKEPSLLPGSFASAEAVAYLAAQKFVMYSPLYRLEQEFNRQGLKLSRQTMANWLLKASAKWLQSVYDLLHKQLCICAGEGHPLPAGAVAVSEKVPGGWPSGAEQQPCRAQHETICDGQKELAVCQYAGRRTGQQRDLQSD